MLERIIEGMSSSAVKEQMEGMSSSAVKEPSRSDVKEAGETINGIDVMSLQSRDVNLISGCS